ncbi:MAG: hypothetical protein IRY90_06740 [Actinomadura rubrobrunea]|nr:hypothetical protein [Actinomadura rubrobrunea]
MALKSHRSRDIAVLDRMSRRLTGGATLTWRESCPAPMDAPSRSPLAVLVVAVAFTGPPPQSADLAPWALYVTFWVGLVPASVLLGPVWRRVNPGVAAVRARPYLGTVVPR